MNNSQLFLGIPILPQNEQFILEKIQTCVSSKYTFCHIVSLNPEIVVIAQKDAEFMNILSESDIQICDGIGIALGGSILGFQVGKRIAGADLMEIILKNQMTSGLHVLLLGGESDIAEKLALCYSKKYPKLTFKGLQGIKDISQPTADEERRIFSIVADYKPQIVFVAFGSPWQEKWIWRHKKKFKGSVCMGVGGGFDFAVGSVQRAPVFVRLIGLEWLFRLILQPWRIKRQTRLFEFMWLVFLQKIGRYHPQYE